ncbi:hypothetical protein QC763_0016720 [Podospora pseudopauciseta]|uniref:Uncharacterized protein n=1 Tax=Podospora pseudopauciseta TaxID=2093780 RepID=A0ABR0I151_9PEZI|nr:hypothetical protein QC763_0016720 [Podospora pseudopauciseta]
MLLNTRWPGSECLDPRPKALKRTLLEIGMRAVSCTEATPVRIEDLANGNGGAPGSQVGLGTDVATPAGCCSRPAKKLRRSEMAGGWLVMASL